MVKNDITILHQSVGNQLFNPIRKEKSRDGRPCFLQCACVAAHKRCKLWFIFGRMQEWRETKNTLEESQIHAFDNDYSD